jgi:hypothetical protein
MGRNYWDVVMAKLGGERGQLTDQDLVIPDLPPPRQVLGPQPIQSDGGMHRMSPEFFRSLSPETRQFMLKDGGEQGAITDQDVKRYPERGGQTNMDPMNYDGPGEDQETLQGTKYQLYMQALKRYLGF